MSDSSSMHWLPCSIDYAGTAKVSAYFQPAGTGCDVEGVPIQEAFFRGRQLKGAQLQLPAGYTGHVLKKEVQELEAAKGSAWRSLEKFQSFTYWKHGIDPTQSDNAQRRLEFLKIQSKLHDAVSDEEIENEIQEPTFRQSTVQ